MSNIKQIHLSGGNILLTNSDNVLFILGQNINRVTGFGNNDDTIYSPIGIGVTLDNDDSVKKFHCYDKLLAIFTTKGKLFVSRHLEIDEKKPTEENSSHGSHMITPEITHNQSDRSYLTRYLTHTVDHLQRESIILDIPIEYLPQRPNGELESNDTTNHSVDVSNENDENSNDENSSDENSSNENSSDENNHVIIQENSGDYQFHLRNDDISQFQNSLYLDSILHMYKKNKRSYNQKSRKGFDLITDEISEILFVSDTILFKKNNSIFIFSKKINPKNISVVKNLGISVIPSGEQKNYYQLFLPFEYEKIVFTDKFIYLCSGNFHHIISGRDHNRCLIYNIKLNLLRKYPFVWFYFRSDIHISEKNIYYDPGTTVIYVKNENDLYKYCYSTHTIEKYSEGDENSKILILTTDDEINIIMFHIKGNDLWIDAGNLKKEINNQPLLKYMIDTDTDSDIGMILIDVDMDGTNRYICSKNILFFNIRGLKYYKLMTNGLIYYDENTLFFYSIDELEESHYGTSEIDKIELSNNTYYVYVFNNLPSNIKSISFTHELILLDCYDKFYYHAIGSDNISLNKFTEITISNVTKNNLLIKHHILYPNINFENKITLSINLVSNNLEKMLSIAEMLPNDYNFSIEQVCKNKVISYGDGPKREFIDTAITFFSDKYLISYNRCCEFNLDMMKDISDDQLYYMGKMLHIMICHNKSHLPIRLPLSLLSALVEKEPTIDELEYFAKIEDPETFKNILECKDNIELIKETGRVDYKHCLLELCKYNYCENNEFNEKIKHISKQIAMGMLEYTKIKNLSIMNLPTLDYYLSGDYLLNRKLFFKNLNVYSPSNTDYSLKVIEIINNLSDDKLSDLLKNWSGTSIVRKSYTYVIHILNDIKDKIFFGTCGTYIDISENLLTDTKFNDQIIDLLTVPINTMVDI